MLIVFGSRPDLHGSSIFKCSIGMKSVDPKVKCEQGAASPLACAVTAMRSTPRSPFNSNWSIMHDFNIRHSMERMYSTVLGAWQNVDDWGSDPTKIYIDDPMAVLSSGLQRDHSFVNLSQVSATDFKNRFGLLFNTFVWGSLGLKSASTLTGGTLAPGYVENTTAAWVYLGTPHYEIDRTWFALFCAGTVLLGICSATSMVLKYRTQAPDIFGSVSSLTRDSRYFDGIPTGGSTLSGQERARLLKGVRVRIQDVDSTWEVGRIALSSEMRQGATGLAGAILRVKDLYISTYFGIPHCNLQFIVPLNSRFSLGLI